MKRVLLDTNILVYAMEPRDPERQEQTLALISGLTDTCQCCLSVQNLSEFANVAIKKLSLSPDEAILLIENWKNLFLIFDLTPECVLEAAYGVRDHQLSWFDAQVWASARLNQVPVVLSEDFQHGQLLGGVQFLNPFKASFQLEDLQ